MKKKATHTLWTSPMGDWTQLLEGVELTAELQAVIDNAAEELDREKFDARVKPYNTPVTNKTLSKSVG